MRSLLAAALLISAGNATFAQQKQEGALPRAPEGTTWKLVWHDEFDGTKLDEYVYYVDGKETWRTKEAVSRVPEYIKLSDEIGKWGGDIAKSKLPDAFLVDYVRVYDLVERK
jgi:hypothetical protein